MGEFRYIPPDETAQRHRAARAATPPRQLVNRQPARRNVEHVLALGATRYITFDSRTYCIPPVRYRLGEQVLDLHIKILADAKQVALTGAKEPMRAFYAKHDRMASLLWKHIRPIGVFKRFLWRIGLMRNPFKRASEADMKAIVDFFLQGRTTSSVRSMSEAEIQRSHG